MRRALPWQIRLHDLFSLRLATPVPITSRWLLLLLLCPALATWLRSTGVWLHELLTCLIGWIQSSAWRRVALANSLHARVLKRRLLHLRIASSMWELWG